ncbi:undecaprenyl-diphosphate phosphatase [Aestuariicella hydrocarbonica]|uniref:Undecaprenyl-diphosphatase n=1 Tax=Pseudomaricurvus hydrocarbonicus TaxID=1470433 RepID=A0A9E5MMP3_9GAMM|nr:undecaprenyl-diphosphate phosphatase [Aestuariicella hydrocarbonica]NHO67060.1 undecaprenyl-diphosphate phosphatase [Aestuariicella hydrocarbonica]
MDAIQSVLLALIQGITEFLPISSSGHLILPSAVLGWPDQGLAFDVAVHVGSLLAVVGYFRHDIIQLITAWFSSFKTGQTENSRLAWYVIWATVPAGLCGLIFNDFIEENLRSVLVIAGTTIIFGAALGWADWSGKRSIELSKMSLKQALLVGCAQALALIPGTSRSGITITAALALGLTRQAAARFSFLLSIPIISLSGGFKTLELLEHETIPWANLLIGVVVAATSAALCIHLFLKWIDRIGMWPFVAYRFLLGFVLLFIALG